MGIGICYVCNRIPGVDNREASCTADPRGYKVRVECERCGTYLAEQDWFDDARDSGKMFPEHAALRLSALIREHTDLQRRPVLVVDYKLVDSLPTSIAPKLSYAASIEKILLTLASTAEYPGMPVRAFGIAELAARVELPDRVASSLLQHVAQQGLIAISGGTTKNTEVSVTPKGWARLDELQAFRPRSDGCSSPCGSIPPWQMPTT